MIKIDDTHRGQDEMHNLLIISWLIVTFKDSLFIDMATISFSILVPLGNSDVDHKTDNSNPDTDNQIPRSTAEVV